MKDASETPRAWKRYKVSNGELKAALDIDWPGKILSVRSNYVNDGFEITMYVQPHELRGEEYKRYAQEISIPVPASEPAPPASAHKRRRWRKS